MHQTLVVTLALVHQLDKVLHQEVAAGAQNWLEEVVVVVMVEMGHCTIKRRDWIGDEAMQGHSNVWILHHRSIGFKMGSREIFRAIVWRTINLHWHATHHKDKHIEKERREKRERERERERLNKLTDGVMKGRREVFGFSTGIETAFELMYMLSYFGLELYGDWRGFVLVCTSQLWWKRRN